MIHHPNRIPASIVSRVVVLWCCGVVAYAGDDHAGPAAGHDACRLFGDLHHHLAPTGQVRGLPRRGKQTILYLPIIQPLASLHHIVSRPQEEGSILTSQLAALFLMHRLLTIICT